MTADMLKSLENLNELCLSDSERQQALNIFEYMEEKVAAMQNIDTDNTEIMVHCMPMINVLREDERKQLFSREDLLAGAPENSEDSWIVPRLVK